VRFFRPAGEQAQTETQRRWMIFSATSYFPPKINQRSTCTDARRVSFELLRHGPLATLSEDRGCRCADPLLATLSPPCCGESKPRKTFPSGTRADELFPPAPATFDPSNALHPIRAVFVTEQIRAQHRLRSRIPSTAHSMTGRRYAVLKSTNCAERHTY